MDCKEWEDIVRGGGNGWPPNFQPISGMRKCDFPVLQQWKEFTLLATKRARILKIFGARILYSCYIHRLQGRVLRSCLEGRPSAWIHKTVHSTWRRHSLEIVWTKPERIHDAKSEWRGIEGNNCGVLLKKIAAMFTFSLSALTHIGRQDGEWELLLKCGHDDVHNFQTCRAEYLCGGGVTSYSKRVRARFSKPNIERLNSNALVK